MRIFIIRAVLGVLFAVFLSRIFYPQAPVIFTIGLCVVLVALAYLTEYLRVRKKAREQASAGSDRHSPR